MSKKVFEFIEPGELIDNELMLCLICKYPANKEKKYVPSYEFEMRNVKNNEKMGAIRLRIGSEKELLYPGHIGYEVNKKYRGNNLAARSSLLILPLAYKHGLKHVWLTVDPHNIASNKTCEKLGAERFETVRVPKTHEMYALGARFRRRYSINIKKYYSSKNWI